MYIRVIILFLFFYSYAFLRYHIGSKVSYSEWYFILNKAFSWFSFTLIGFSILSKKWFKNRQLKRKNSAIIGFIFALIHLNSIIFLFSYEHYPVFYLDEQHISFLGYCIICVGILALICFFIALCSSLNLISKKYLKFGYFGFIIILIHPFLIGFQKWFIFWKWPIYLPPITLIAFLSGIILLIFRLSNHKK
jgi:hypothetical protein